MPPKLIGNSIPSIFSAPTCFRTPAKFLSANPTLTLFSTSQTCSAVGTIFASPCRLCTTVSSPLILNSNRTFWKHTPSQKFTTPFCQSLSPSNASRRLLLENDTFCSNLKYHSLNLLNVQHSMLFLSLLAANSKILLESIPFFGISVVSFIFVSKHISTRPDYYLYIYYIISIIYYYLYLFYKPNFTTSETVHSSDSTFGFFSSVDYIYGFSFYPIVV